MEYEVIDHGPDHHQYFSGCGTAYSGFDHVVTGAGHDSREAFNDALDQMACAGYNTDGIRGVSKLSRRVAKYEDWYYYVSIRFNNARGTQQ